MQPLAQPQPCGSPPLQPTSSNSNQHIPHSHRIHSEAAKKSRVIDVEEAPDAQVAEALRLHPPSNTHFTPPQLTAHPPHHLSTPQHPTTDPTPHQANPIPTPNLTPPLHISPPHPTIQTLPNHLSTYPSNTTTPHPPNPSIPYPNTLDHTHTHSNPTQPSPSHLHDSCMNVYGYPHSSSPAFICIHGCPGIPIRTHG
jgi:hypothetical protein